MRNCKLSFTYSVATMLLIFTATLFKFTLTIFAIILIVFVEDNLLGVLTLPFLFSLSGFSENFPVFWFHKQRFIEQFGIRVQDTFYFSADKQKR